MGVGGCGSGWDDSQISNRIEISWFVKVLSCFNRFGGHPMGVGGVDGFRCGCRLVQQSPQT